MTENYRNAIATYGASLITHIGLVNASGIELSGGRYTRQPVTWLAASNGTIRPNVDLMFDVNAGTTVAGWRAYTALSGGTDYGGGDLTTETFAENGAYKLIASGTGIAHN